MKQNIGIKQRLLHIAAMNELFNKKKSLINDKSFVDVLEATLRFNEALKRNSNLGDIMTLLEVKHCAAIKFKHHFGVDWLF